MEIWCRWLLKNLPALDEVGWFENLTKANFLALPNEDIDRSVFFNLVGQLEMAAQIKSTYFQDFNSTGLCELSGWQGDFSHPKCLKCKKKA